MRVQTGGVVSTLLTFDDAGATVADLTAALAPLAPPGRTLRLIHAGTALRDPAALLSATLPNPSSGAPARVLVLAGPPPAAADPVTVAAARAARLEALEAEAAAIGARVAGGRGGGGGHGRGGAPPSYVLEGAPGGAPPAMRALPRASQASLVQGLALAARGRASLAAGDAAAARDELLLAEERFASVSAASPAGRALLGGCDNVALAVLDACWAAFLIKDVAALAGGRARLAFVRTSLEALHGGPAMSRLGTAGPAGAAPGAAAAPLLARLLTLEGIAAWHGGDVPAARAALLAAAAAWQASRPPGEAAVGAVAAAAGCSTRAATRALSLCGDASDVATATGLAQRTAAAESARQAALDAAAASRRAWGKTAGGRPVDPATLDAVASMGYERPLAAAALRQVDNDVGAALDALGDPATAAVLVQEACDRADRVGRRDRRQRARREEEGVEGRGEGGGGGEDADATGSEGEDARRGRGGGGGDGAPAAAPGAGRTVGAALANEDALSAYEAFSVGGQRAAVGDALVEYLGLVGEAAAVAAVSAGLAG
jgi:hypothetical protein